MTEDYYDSELEKIEKESRRFYDANLDLTEIDVLALAGVRSSRKRRKT